MMLQYEVWFPKISYLELQVIKMDISRYFLLMHLKAHILS